MSIGSGWRDCSIKPSGKQRKLAFFGGIKNAKFRKQVIPGDRLRLETEIIKCKGPMGIGKAVATVDGKLAAEAEISFMCTDAK